MLLPISHPALATDRNAPSRAVSATLLWKRARTSSVLPGTPESQLSVEHSLLPVECARQKAVIQAYRVRRKTCGPSSREEWLKRRVREHSCRLPEPDAAQVKALPPICGRSNGASGERVKADKTFVSSSPCQRRERLRSITKITRLNPASKMLRLYTRVRKLICWKLRRLRLRRA